MSFLCSCQPPLSLILPGSGYGTVHFIFTKSTKTSLVFQGCFQYEIYSKLPFNLSIRNKNELVATRVGIGYLGKSLCRKGLVSMVSVGCTVSP